MAQDYRHLFERYTPPDMLVKLERELDRFRQATTRSDREDHMMNFVWTAWHLRERMWYSMEELDQVDRRKIENSLGATWNSNDAFRDWAKEQCPALGACRQLTNSCKHPGSTDIAKDEHVVDVTARPSSPSSKVDFADVDNAQYWLHEIRYGSDTWETVDGLFDNVVDFWTKAVCYGQCINWDAAAEGEPSSFG